VKDIKDYLGVSAKVKLVEPKDPPAFEGKASALTTGGRFDDLIKSRHPAKPGSRNS